jgi:hypothetical protein
MCPVSSSFFSLRRQRGREEKSFIRDQETRKGFSLCERRKFDRTRVLGRGSRNTKQRSGRQRSQLFQRCLCIFVTKPPRTSRQKCVLSKSVFPENYPNSCSHFWLYDVSVFFASRAEKRQWEQNMSVQIRQEIWGSISMTWCVSEEVFALLNSIECVIRCKSLKPIAMNDCVSIDWENPSGAIHQAIKNTNFCGTRCEKTEWVGHLIFCGKDLNVVLVQDLFGDGGVCWLGGESAICS